MFALNLCLNVFVGTPLGDQAIASYNAAITQSTQNNRLTHATTYLTFAVHYGLDILHPTLLDGCLFQQYLANTLKSKISRKCYTSGATIWIQERGGDPSPLVSLEAKTVAKGAYRLAPHIPNPAPALTPSDLIEVCKYLDQAPSGLPVKAAITIGFFAFLRASNLLSPTALLWTGPHTLTRGDIVSNIDGLWVIIRSSKTILPGTPPTVIELPRIPGSPACPAAAWDAYQDMYPGPLHGPAFLTFDGHPLTPTQMVVVLQSVLSKLGCPYASSIRSHSLRRGGAQAAQMAQCSTDEIAHQGTWKSVSGLRAYVPSQTSHVVATKLATLFAPLNN